MLYKNELFIYAIKGYILKDNKQIYKFFIYYCSFEQIYTRDDNNMIHSFLIILPKLERFYK